MDDYATTAKDRAIQERLGAIGQDYAQGTLETLSSKAIGILSMAHELNIKLDGAADRLFGPRPASPPDPQAIEGRRPPIEETLDLIMSALRSANAAAEKLAARL